MPSVMMLQKLNEVQQVRGIEGAMDEGFQVLKVRRAMILYKVIGSVPHHVHKPLATLDDGPPLPPCQDGGEKPCNLDILPLDEKMRDRNWIIRNKPGTVKPIGHFVQHFLERRRRKGSAFRHLLQKSYFYPAVDHTRIVILVGDKGLLFAIPICREPGRIHTFGNEVAPDTVGPVSAQFKVILFAPDIIRVS